MKNKAPSIIIDPTVLGDRRPRDKDSVAQKTEDTKRFREKNHTIGNQDMLANSDMANVNYLDPVDFQHRLRKLNAAFRFCPSNNRPYICTGAVMFDDETDSPTYSQLVVRTVPGCSFRGDFPIPEFSHVGLDKWGIATSERDGDRGWRTVLLNLIKQGFLKYSAVKAEFGEPLGQRGKLWHEQLREYKI